MTSYQKGDHRTENAKAVKRECRDSREKQAEILKCRFKEEKPRQKAVYSAQECDDEEEISSIQHHSENEESAEPVVGSRPQPHSWKGMQPTTGSERLDKSIERHLEERLRSAISRGQRREEDLFFIKKSSKDFLEVRKAEYVSQRKRIQRERKLLFTPSSRPVPDFIKLPENMRPSYLEDEGLYVGKRPPMSQTNENILENRILIMEEGKKWIGDDGRIMALPNPVKESSTRPPVFHKEEDLDPALQTVYRKATRSTYKKNKCTDGTLDPKGDYQLDLEVFGLTFSHHPLFSREHVLGARLVQLHDQFLTRQHNNRTGHLTDKLNGLRSALRNILDIHDSQSLTQAMQQRISDYSLEVRNTRQLRDSEQEKDRTLLKDIIKVWKDIKDLREFQKFTNTPYKLFLRKENVDQASDEQVYEDEIFAEVVELEAESEEDYQRKLAEYKKQLAEWKLSRRKQKAKKKKRKKKKTGQLQDEEEDEDQELSESEGPEEEDCPKPEPPERPDFDSIEQQVREKAVRIRRKPGESVLIPELHASGNITDNDLCPRVEVARRQDVERHSFVIRIVYNRKGVSRTDSCFLDTDFRVHFGNVSLEEFEFSSNQRVMFDHEGVGSDVPLSFEPDGSNKQTLLTSGKLTCCVSWGIGEDDVPLAPPVSKQPAGIHSGLRLFDAVTSIWGCELDDRKKTVERARQLPLDPNDPTNDSIMQLLKMTRSEEVHAPKYFRLEQLQEEFYFVTDEALELKCTQRLRREVSYKTVQIHACSLQEILEIQRQWWSKLSPFFLNRNNIFMKPLIALEKIVNRARP